MEDSVQLVNMNGRRGVGAGGSGGASGKSADLSNTDKHGNKIASKSDKVATGVSLATTVVEFAAKGNLLKVATGATTIGVVTGFGDNGFQSYDAFNDGNYVEADLQGLQALGYAVAGGVILFGGASAITIGGFRIVAIAGTAILINTGIDFVEYGYKNW